ncbi:Arf-GAP with coiled-coil, ANK repeat and PH domain-containing protein 3, partial [Geodia barretti]
MLLFPSQVDFMTSQLSYFHLGQVTIDDVRPYMENTYTIMEKLRSKASLHDAQQRTQTTSLLGEVLLVRAKDLANFHTHDLHFNTDTAKSTVMRHLKEQHSSVAVEEKELDNFDEKMSIPPNILTKSGYLWYAETKTFGTHWTRLFFCIKKDMLVSAESTAKIRVPISLNLNLCSVKPAQVTDTERNFCFKVISPIRSLLLQAESSRDMQQWMEVLQNAISHALHCPSTPEKERTFTNLASTSSSSSSSAPTSSSTHTSLPSSSSPIPPVRRKTKSKVNVTKELYAVAGNEACADCGNTKPKWASINLGVLVCIECSGVHRSLGVYVSQVRSLTLDTLKPEWLEKLKEFGNKNSNGIYEKNLPEDFDREAVRTEEGRQEFITEKYIELKYTGEEERETIREQRKETRAESVRRSNKLISHTSCPAGAETQKPEGAAVALSSSQATGGASHPATARSNSFTNSLLSSLKSDAGNKQSGKKDRRCLREGRRRRRRRRRRTVGRRVAGEGRLEGRVREGRREEG